MSTSLRAGVGALIAGVLTIAGLAIAVPTGAEVKPSDVASLSFQFIDGDYQLGDLRVYAIPSAPCDSNIVPSDVTVLVGGVPITDDSLVTVIGMNDNDLIDLVIHPTAAGAPGTINTIGVSLSCLSSTTPTVFNGGIPYAQLDITKTVVGAGPADGQFAVNATCTPPIVGSVGSTEPTAISTTSLDFVLTAGQTASVFAALPGIGGSCAITETDSLGAVNSSVTPGIVPITTPTRSLVSVVNTFPEATPKFTG